MSDAGVKMICDMVKDLAGGAVGVMIALWLLGFFDGE
jgi:hypothetical protein